MKTAQTKNWSGPEGAHSFRRTEGRFKKDSTKTTLIQERRGVNNRQPERLRRFTTAQSINDSGQGSMTRRRANGGARSGDYVVPRPLNLVGREFRERWLPENVRCDLLGWFTPAELEDR